MSLIVKRTSNESWRQCVIRIAGRYGLQHECLTLFDRYISAGDADQDAAWKSLYDWDCLDLSAPKESV